MDQNWAATATGVLEIVWVNVVLSGDNAVVIALACRDLPPRLKRTGMVLGAGVAIVLRIVFTALVASLLTTPFVKLAGGVLLIWIGAKLLAEDGSDREVRPSERLWAAVRVVAISDAIMSLDNVLAIAAVANGSTFLLVLGLLVSIPLIVAGAGLIIRLLDRLPVLIWAGAALLGWVAGEMMATDPFVVGQIGLSLAEEVRWPAALAGIVLVLGGGAAWRHRRERALPALGR